MKKGGISLDFYFSLVLDLVLVFFLQTIYKFIDRDYDHRQSQAWRFEGKNYTRQ